MAGLKNQKASDESQTRSSSSSRSTSLPVSSKRRRKAQKEHELESENNSDATLESSRDPSPLPQRVGHTAKRKNDLKPPDAGVDLFSDVGRFVTGTVLHALRLAFAFLKTPLAFLLSLFIIYRVAISFTPSIDTLISPLCTSPYVSWVLPICHATFTSSADFPKLLEIQTELEGVLELAGGSALAIELRNSEDEMRELVALARVSDLQGKEELALHLEDISNQGRGLARGLQGLGTRIGGAVERIIITNKYALNTLERIDKEGDSSFALVPFMASATRKRQDLSRSFLNSADFTAKQLKILEAEVEVELVNLNRLESSVGTLNEHILQQQKEAKKDLKDLKIPFVGFLGLYKGDASSVKANIELLRQMSTDRKDIRKRLTAALHKLSQLSDQVNDLRDRFMLPKIVGADGVIPLEVHLESIRRGADKMQEFLTAAKQKEDQQLRQRAVDPSKQKRPVQAVIERA